MEASPDIDPKLLEILVCPLTKAPLRYDREAQELVSEEAGLAYPVRDGIPIMLVDEARPLREDEKTTKRLPHAVSARSPRWPVELRLKQAEKTLEVTFDDGARFRLAAEYLRGREPLGRGAGPRPRPEDRWCRGAPMSASLPVEAVGNYAVRLVFDDLHDTGIYSWDYLHQLGVEHDKRWREYLAALAAQGLSREPSRS